MIPSYLKKVACLFIFFSVYIVQAQKLFNLYGDAKKEPGGVYILTENKQSQSGLVVSLFPIDLNQPFSKTFELYFGGNDSGADGMTFSFLNACNVGGSGVGAGLGTGGITEILSVEFDTFQNTEFGDPPEDHMAIMSKGNADHNKSEAITEPIKMDNIENDSYHKVKVTWTPNSNHTQTFEIEFIHSNGKTYTQIAKGNFIHDIFKGNSIVFWGVSASTGQSSNLQKLRIQENDRAEKYSCKGNTITLNAPLKGTNYFWTSNPSTAIRDNTNPSISVSPLQTGTKYICDYTDYCGRGHQTVNYTIYVPEFSENHIDPTCNQQGSITLSVKDGKAPYTYTLDGISKQSNIETYTFNNLSAGDHHYTIETSTGCSEAGSITFKTSSSPLPPDVPNQSYCSGSQTPVLEIKNPNSNYTYTWYDEKGQSIKQGFQLDCSGLSPPRTSGSFTVTATDKTTGRASLPTTVKLIEEQQPSVSVTANHPVLFYGQTLELHSRPSSESTSLSWKGPNGFRSQQENPVIPSVQQKHSGTYELTLSNDAGCSATSQRNIKVHPDVETALGEDVVSCSDGTSFTFSYPKENGLTYQWSGPNGFSRTENEITVTEVGVYTLTVRASDGNESVGSVRIQASDLRVEKVNSCLAQTIVNPSGGRPPYEYSLDGITFQSSPIFKGDFNRAHMIYVKDTNGCEVIEEAKGFKFDLYWEFSPNGDGINDRWDLSALSGCVKVQVKIFDRYGRYVYKMGLKNLSWDGTVKGKALPSGTYWYVIEFNDGATPVLKGNITIKRRKD